MNCGEVRDLIALGAGGETSDNERIAIESHVSVCAECARELAETRTHLGNLALLREGEMPAGAAERIWRGVRSAVPGARRPVILEWSLRAAALLIVGVSVGYTGTSMVGRGAPTSVALENESHDDYPSTLIRTKYSNEAFGRAPQDPAQAGIGAPMSLQIVPQAWHSHYLLPVDEVLESDEVRF